jgi:hypothetical protein
MIDTFCGGPIRFLKNSEAKDRPEAKRDSSSVAEIQKILRHQSASTTEKYIKSLGFEVGRKAMERSFERDRSVKVIDFNEIRKAV